MNVRVDPSSHGHVAGSKNAAEPTKSQQRRPCRGQRAADRDGGECAKRSNHDYLAPKCLAQRPEKKRSEREADLVERDEQCRRALVGDVEVPGNGVCRAAMKGRAENAVKYGDYAGGHNPQFLLLQFPSGSDPSHLNWRKTYRGPVIRTFGVVRRKLDDCPSFLILLASLSVWDLSRFYGFSY
jgi:hypothetical protein